MGDTENNGSLLNRSLYLKGLRCYKSLYLNKHHPELRDAPHPSRRTRKRNSARVNEIARNLFPGGVEIPRKKESHGEPVELTAGEILRGATTLYDAAFTHDGVSVSVDILHRGWRGWEIYEVKDAARVKEMYIEDAALQYYVLRGSLLPVAKANVVHINRGYVRNGEIRAGELFTIRDVTEEVAEKQLSVGEEVRKQKGVLGGPMPGVDIGRHCADIEDCGFKGHCWQHIPEDSVFSLKGKGVDKLALYAQGIVLLQDVPLENMSPAQRIQAAATLKKRNYVNREGVADFLRSIRYPLFFLDFETLMDPIPPFDGTKPYEQVPFLYSLHSIPDEKSGVRHSEFLAPSRGDPRMGMMQKLLDEIPEEACVLVYGRSFETEVLRNMMRWFPEPGRKAEAVIHNIVDLAVPFRRRDVYFWKMRGSTSIKAVLPALVPGLSYEGLDISDGGAAMEAFYEMCGARDAFEAERIGRSLRAYCRLDTLAMVKILEKLRNLSCNL